MFSRSPTLWISRVRDGLSQFIRPLRRVTYFPIRFRGIGKDGVD